MTGYLLIPQRVQRCQRVIAEYSDESDGISLIEPFLGQNGAVTGSARRFEEARARRRAGARRS